MNLRFIDWIWHVRGALPVPEGQSGAEALARLEPLFHQMGTSHVRGDDVLEFSKTDPASQDPMAVFDAGTLRIEQGPQGALLRYRLKSRALLFCLLAPLLFLAFAQLTIWSGAGEKPKDAAAQEEKAKKQDALPPMNPVDKFLGAPAPEKPKDGEGGGRRGRKPSPTPSYVFAGIFAVLYVVGRILEDRLVRRLFRKTLAAE